MRHPALSRSLARLRGAALLLATLAGGVAVAAERRAGDEAALLRHNKALVEGFFRDVFAKADADAAARYLAPGYIQHNPAVPTGLTGFQTFFRPQFASMPPDVKAALRMDVLHIVAEGNLVVIHVRFHGIDSSGKPFDRSEFDLFRVEGDRIAEHWDATG